MLFKNAREWEDWNGRIKTVEETVYYVRVVPKDNPPISWRFDGDTAEEDSKKCLYTFLGDTHRSWIEWSGKDGDFYIRPDDISQVTRYSKQEGKTVING